MPPIRLAVATRLFDQPLKASLQSAADAGADGVQFDVRQELRPESLSGTGRRQFLHHLDELGLVGASLWMPLRRTLYDLDELDARLAAVRAAIEFAAQLKIKILALRAGRVPEDAASADAQLLTSTLNDLARIGNRQGVILALTPAREEPALLRQLLDSVTEGPVGVNLDPAVFVMAGMDPSDTFRTLHDRVNHVQVRDAIRDADGGGLEVPVGRGEVAWDELLAVAEEANYRSWFTVDRTQGDSKPADATRAISYLRRLALG
jgi:sugar phosphate isomerase/epimerase